MPTVQWFYSPGYDSHPNGNHGWLSICPCSAQTIPHSLLLNFILHRTPRAKPVLHVVHVISTPVTSPQGLFGFHLLLLQCWSFKVKETVRDCSLPPYHCLRDTDVGRWRIWPPLSWDVTHSVAYMTWALGCLCAHAAVKLSCATFSLTVCCPFSSSYGHFQEGIFSGLPRASSMPGECSSMWLDPQPSC